MTGPRVGSRPWALAQMAPGDSKVLETKAGNGAKLMQQIGVDARRANVKIECCLLLAVEPATRTVTDIVRVTAC